MARLYAAGIFTQSVFVFSTVPGLHAGEGAERDRVHARRLRKDEGKAQNRSTSDPVNTDTEAHDNPQVLVVIVFCIVSKWTRFSLIMFSEVLTIPPETSSSLKCEVVHFCV